MPWKAYWRRDGWVVLSRGRAYWRGMVELSRGRRTGGGTVGLCRGRRTGGGTVGLCRGRRTGRGWLGYAVEGVLAGNGRWTGFCWSVSWKPYYRYRSCQLAGRRPADGQHSSSHQPALPSLLPCAVEGVSPSVWLAIGSAISQPSVGHHPAVIPSIIPPINRKPRRRAAFSVGVAGYRALGRSSPCQYFFSGA